MTAPVLGIGTVPFRSYWLTFLQLDQTVVWEGLVDAEPVIDQHGRVGLNVARTSVPPAVQQQLSTLPGFRTQWSPAWEQVDVPTLPKEHV